MTSNISHALSEYRHNEGSYQTIDAIDDDDKMNIAYAPSLYS